MMDRCISFAQALELAIRLEQAKTDFYALMADQTSEPAMSEIFRGFVREEKAHKAKLEFIKSTGESNDFAAQMIDFKVTDCPVNILPCVDMDFCEALKLAMKNEKLAFKLYNALAANAPNDPLRAAFSTLALEEANHKLHFEIAFDDLGEESESK
jgi:rubrerythrin